MQTSRLVLMTDASFSHAAGMKSHLGYAHQMVEATRACNILRFVSNKCQRIARSVMAAEVEALVLIFDYGFLVKDLVDELIGRPLYRCILRN